MSKIQYFNSFNEWIEGISNYNGDLVTPKRAAYLVQVSKACITNWVHRDGKVRSLIYESEIDGRYVVIDKSDVITARMTSRKQKTLNITTDQIVSKNNLGKLT